MLAHSVRLWTCNSVVPGWKHAWAECGPYGRVVHRFTLMQTVQRPIGVYNATYSIVQYKKTFDFQKKKGIVPSSCFFLSRYCHK